MIALLYYIMVGLTVGSFHNTVIKRFQLLRGRHFGISGLPMLLIGMTMGGASMSALLVNAR